MTTGLTIVTKAMQKCGILTKGQVPTGDEANDALSALNSMIALWANDSMNIYARTWESFTLTGGTASYTIGTSQTFNTARPVLIASAYVRNNTTDTNVSIVADEIYNQLIQKDTQGIPEILNFDNAFPSATIRLFPVPSAAYTLFLLNEKPLTAFTLAGTVSLPPGWETALIFNLPEHIAGDYDQEVPASVQKIAISSKAGIQKSIMKNRSLDAFPQQMNQGNVLTGWP